MPTRKPKGATTAPASDRPLGKDGQPAPISLRLSAEDHAILKELESRTGLGRSSVLKLALRRLLEWQQG